MPRSSLPAVLRLCRCPWECPHPYSNLNEYQEAVRQHASNMFNTALIDTLLSLHNKNVSEG